MDDIKLADTPAPAVNTEAEPIAGTPRHSLLEILASGAETLVKTVEAGVEKVLHVFDTKDETSAETQPDTGLVADDGSSPDIENTESKPVDSTEAAAGTDGFAPTTREVDPKAPKAPVVADPVIPVVPADPV